MDKRIPTEELAQAHQDLFGTPVAFTQCANCDEMVMLQEATVTTHHITPYITETEHYCSAACALEYWRKMHGVQHVE